MQPFNDQAPAGANDFDFVIGDWRVSHRRLKRRLAGDQDWEEFGGASSTRKILGGLGNIEDNWINLPGGAYRAVAVRSFDPEAGTWAIWWLDARAPHRLDVPVIGGFKDGVGAFFAEDVLDGRAIKVRFLWTRTDTASPQWEQAFSPDGGASWETNWMMRFDRAA